jgi:hypothetical protein
MNTKLHAVTDANGRPLRFFMTAGQVSDYTGAELCWTASLRSHSNDAAHRRNLGLLRPMLTGYWLTENMTPTGSETLYGKRA